MNKEKKTNRKQEARILQETQEIMPEEIKILDPTEVASDTNKPPLYGRVVSSDTSEQQVFKVEVMPLEQWEALQRQKREQEKQQKQEQEKDNAEKEKEIAKWEKEHPIYNYLQTKAKRITDAQPHNFHVSKALSQYFPKIEKEFYTTLLVKAREIAEKELGEARAIQATPTRNDLFKLLLAISAQLSIDSYQKNKADKFYNKGLLTFEAAYPQTPKFFVPEKDKDGRTQWRESLSPFIFIHESSLMFLAYGVKKPGFYQRRKMEYLIKALDSSFFPFLSSMQEEQNRRAKKRQTRGRKLVGLTEYLLDPKTGKNYYILYVHPYFGELLLNGFSSHPVDIAYRLNTATTGTEKDAVLELLIHFGECRLRQKNKPYKENIEKTMEKIGMLGQFKKNKQRALDSLRDKLNKLTSESIKLFNSYDIVEEKRGRKTEYYVVCFFNPNYGKDPLFIPFDFSQDAEPQKTK